MGKPALTPTEIVAIERFEGLAANGTLYALLGVDTRATRDDVENAYRAYVREWHPDRMFSKDAEAWLSRVEANFVEVTRAYKTLRDNGKRGLYDAELRSQGVVVADTAPVVDERIGFEVVVERRPKAASASTITMAQPLGAAAKFSPPPAPIPPPPAAPPSAAAKLREQIAEQLGRAADYYKAGLADFEAGRFSKAESALYLAMRYDSRNTAYADLFRLSQQKARQGRAGSYVQLARQAEEFGNIRDAITNLKKAVECEPEEGVAYFRLAKLTRTYEEDSRESLNLLRKASQKEPKNTEYRLALSEMYLELKMEQNALREAQAAWDLEPKNEKARALVKQLRATAR